MKKKNKKTKVSASVIARVVIVLFVLFLAFASFQKGVTALRNSDYFMIRKILYPPALRFIVSDELDNLKGRNIFTIDLKKLQRRLEYRYPEISQLRIVRQFPDQIHITAKERLPFARVVVGRQIVTIDKELTVLPVKKTSAFVLPLIEGVSAKRMELDIGSQLKGRELYTAMSIIYAFRKSDILSSYTIEKIDVGNLSKVELYISNIPKIVMDQNNIDRKFQVLTLVLSRAKDELDSIRYIDLRFKEPILKKR